MPQTLAANAMGTRFELVLDGDEPHRLRAIGELALHEVREWHDRLNLFSPGSLLNVINARAAEGPVAVDDLTFELLRLCARVYRESMGAFDITVAPLMRALGFHDPDATPNPESIDHASRRCGMRLVQLDAPSRTVRFTRDGMRMDLGAVAKGFAIDAAIGLLREHGVTCALIHGGTSTVATIGAPPGEAGWRVAVRNGRDPSEEDAMPVLCLKDNAMSVSAPHGRTIRRGDETLGHVLDTRSGRPARCGPFAAAVSGSTALADAWSTALLVLGHRPPHMPDEIMSILPDSDTRASKSWTCSAHTTDSRHQGRESILS